MKKLLKRILGVYRKFRFWYFAIWKGVDHDNVYKTPHLNFFTRLKYARLGFTKTDYFFLNLKDNVYHNYISQWERLRLENVNGRFAPILGEKVMFERIFGQVVNVPKIVGYVKSGKIFTMNKDTIHITGGGLLGMLANGTRMIAKPTRSLGGGHGIHVFGYENGSYILDGKNINETELEKFILSLEEYLLSEFVEQGDFEASFFPCTTNTIRIITVMKDGRAKTVMAGHRFGTAESIPVDNVCSGGVFNTINIETGDMTFCCSYNHPDLTYQKHPDSGVQIEGIRIPYFDKIKTALEDAHNCFPYYKFFAWDVIVGKNGNFWVCEINRGSGLRNWQMITPLRNEPLGKWMRSEGLLDKW